MTHQTKTFTVADPRTFDGDPFDVAERAVRQSAALAGIFKDSLEGTRLMVRNAELERQLSTTGACDAPGFDTSAQGKKLEALETAAAEAVRVLEALAKAAGYNPKNPPRA